ncbi:MAG TPA: hypothetical protein VF961_01755 [Pyrinomonadaceae bacterium]
MPATLTEDEFSKHVNTKFRLRLNATDSEPRVELELAEVKGYAKKAEEHSGMERFSAFFDGPGNVQLPQGVYSLSHDRMGEFEIFLVPIARDERGFRYEAVFNYFKEQ